MLKKSALPILLAAGFSFMSLNVAADWTLDSKQSSLHFVSIKNGTTAETHRFAELEGKVADNGKVNLGVHLASVETQIPIRNERMQEMLFDTKNTPMANITAQVDVAGFEKMAEGTIANKDVKLTLSLHGKTIDYDTRLQVVKLANGGIAVSTKQPLLVKAEDFGLGDGVEALREIAGLTSIAAAEPVTANLVFRVNK
ncbi:MAG: YceI family protein [Marinobacter sp.]|nr:YceI family protein [Marinobacter sp.]